MALVAQVPAYSAYGRLAVSLKLLFCSCYRRPSTRAHSNVAGIERRSMGFAAEDESEEQASNCANSPTVRRRAPPKPFVSMLKRLAKDVRIPN